MPGVVTLITTVIPWTHSVDQCTLRTELGIVIL